MKLNNHSSLLFSPSLILTNKHNRPSQANYHRLSPSNIIIFFVFLALSAASTPRPQQQIKRTPYSLYFDIMRCDYFIIFQHRQYRFRLSTSSPSRLEFLFALIDAVPHLICTHRNWNFTITICGGWKRFQCSGFLMSGNI